MCRCFKVQQASFRNEHVNEIVEVRSESHVSIYYEVEWESDGIRAVE